MKNDYQVAFKGLKSTAERVDSMVKSRGRLVDGCDREELSVVHMRYIEELYGDYGPDVVDLMHADADVEGVLRVILQRARLWQKLDEVEDYYKYEVDELLRKGLVVQVDYSPTLELPTSPRSTF